MSSSLRPLIDVPIVTRKMVRELCEVFLQFQALASFDRRLVFIDKALGGSRAKKYSFIAIEYLSVIKAENIKAYLDNPMLYNTHAIASIAKLLQNECTDTSSRAEEIIKRLQSYLEEINETAAFCAKFTAKANFNELFEENIDYFSAVIFSYAAERLSKAYDLIGKLSYYNLQVLEHNMTARLNVYQVFYERATPSYKGNQYLIFDSRITTLLKDKLNSIAALIKQSKEILPLVEKRIAKAKLASTAVTPDSLAIIVHPELSPIEEWKEDTSRTPSPQPIQIVLSSIHDDKKSSKPF